MSTRIAVESESLKRQQPPPNALITRDVGALARVAVAARVVSTAVDHPAHGLDAEVAVANRAIAGQLRGADLDVEPVVLGAACTIAPELGVHRLRHDVDPVLPGPDDLVTTDHVAHRAKRASHSDRVSLAVTDGVACEDVAIAAVDLDRGALAVSC